MFLVLLPLFDVTIDQCVEDELAVLLNQVVDVAEDSTATVSAALSRYPSGTNHMIASAC